MGIHHRQTTLKRRIDIYMDHNATAEKIAENRTIKTVIAAAALTLKVFYRFPDPKIREFVDDLDLRLEPLLDDQDVVNDILDGLEIMIRTDSGTNAQNRIRIEHADRNLCESCKRCNQNSNNEKYGEFFCDVLKLRFRRGRSRCGSWIGSGNINRWQRKIMETGGPPEHMDF